MRSRFPLAFLQYHQYNIVGRHSPTEADPSPQVYRMKLWALDDVRAKSKFWCAACPCAFANQPRRMQSTLVVEPVPAVDRPGEFAQARARDAFRRVGEPAKPKRDTDVLSFPFTTILPKHQVLPLSPQEGEKG